MPYGGIEWSHDRRCRMTLKLISRDSNKLRQGRRSLGGISRLPPIFC